MSMSASKDLNALTNLKTISEKVKFVFSNTRVQSKYSSTVSDIPNRVSDESKSTELKDKGNDLFKQKKYLDATHCYTKSIRWAALGTEGRSIALANRSAGSEHLQKYQESLRDIEACLQDDSYPVRLRHKVLLRKTKCYVQLQMVPEAEKALRDLSVQVEQDHSMEKFKKTIEHLQKQIDGLKEKMTERKPQEPHVTRMPKQTVTLNPVVGFCKDTSYGRHLKANETISVGEVVMVDAPFASIVNSEYREQHCYHCFTPIFLNYSFPCKGTCSANFCGVRCQQEAWQEYHKHECRFMDLLDRTGLGHLAYKMLLAGGVEMIEAFKAGLVSDEVSNGVLLNWKLSSYEAILKLETHDDAITGEDMYGYLIVTTILTHCLIQSGFFDTTMAQPNPNEISGQSFNLDDPLVQSSACLLLHNLLQLLCNGTAVVRHSQDPSVSSPFVLFDSANVPRFPVKDRYPRLCFGVKSMKVGTAIYRVSSLMNHSCSPNVTVCFKGNLLTVKALKVIHESDQIFTSYGPLHFRDDVDFRRDSLQLQYRFLCNCLNCKLKTPTAKTLRCPDCSTPTASVLDDVTARCHRCTKEFNPTQQLTRLYSVFSQIVKLNPHTVFNEQIDGILVESHRVASVDSGYISELLLSAAAVLPEDNIMHLRFLLRALRSYKCVYGEHSAELLVPLSQLKWLAPSYKSMYDNILDLHFSF